MTTSKIAYDQFLFLDSVEKKGKNIPLVGHALYIGDATEPSIQGEQTLESLLQHLIESKSIPSNPLTTKEEYRQDLLRSLDAIEACVRKAKEQVKNMPLYAGAPQVEQSVETTAPEETVVKKKKLKK